MKTISPEVIEEQWEQVQELDEDQIQGVMESMTQRQPALVAYLLAGGEQAEDPSFSEQLIFLGVFIWRIMSYNQPSLKQVEPEDLEMREEENIRFLQELEEGSEMDYFNALGSLMSDYNQMPLLSSIIEALMEDFAEDPNLADENVGLHLLHLKTIIDCLDQE